MPDSNPITNPTSPHPPISKTTLLIAGLQVDVYGLAELAPLPAPSVSCLWLHHPRGRRREDMAGIAQQVLGAYYYYRNHNHNRARGLIAVAFDQRNHGSRAVVGGEEQQRANGAWREGNPTHAQDMFGVVAGAVVDTALLLDALGGYLFVGAGGGPGGRSAAAAAAAAEEGATTTTTTAGRRVDQNLVLGVSLGGHSAWQLLFAEPRVTAGVMVIGCPDYMNLMQDRARLSKLQTWSATDNGASFFGSRDFPDALIAACKKFDPKGIVFGTGEISCAPSAAEQDRIRSVLDARVRGKKFQVLSGGADKLVPYATAKPFLDFLKTATTSWYKDGAVSVEDNVYQGVGHEFNAEMRKDATRFILDAVDTFDKDSKVASSKI
ncbi:hypothetical protein F5X96DRAFT_489724 [Biscogniauxia mediterranea]|nr:hypothetical protein F5X96DRAFT_489724 [Biscogniauxia mediterranea]